MASLKTNYLDELKFDSTQLATLRQLGEYRGKQILYSKQSPEALESLQETAKVESTESSNRLEGIEVPHKRLEDLVLQNSKPKNRSEQEVAGYRDALALIHGSAKEMKFSSNIILQLHKTIYSYMAQPGGKWKATDNEIIERHPDGTTRIRFKPVPAFQTPMKMQELEENYLKALDEGKSDPLIVIPLAILDFLCIHPFSDGNGRVARLITLISLYHFDYQVGRYISLERIFEETKEDYYRTLEESSKGWHASKHDVGPWINYFWVVLLRAYREFEERVGKIKPGKGSKSDQVRQAVLRQKGSFAISEIENECPWITRDWIRLVLREMKAEKLIQLQGKGRGAKWRLLK
ncbi:MAG: Fic family protein [Oligoflexia bacterium]|nr:Fic family protein [Oligoflexia bacterium]